MTLGDWPQKALVFLLGLAAAAILLEAGFWAAGSLRAQARAGKLKRHLQTAGTVRILCVGDSLTAGGYPSYLEEELNRRSRKPRFAVIDRAQAGVAINFLAERLASDLETYAPHIVILMAGIEFPSIQRGLDQRWWYGLRLGRFAATLSEQLREKKRIQDAARGAAVHAPGEEPDRGRDAEHGDLLFAQGRFGEAATCYGRALAAGGGGSLRTLWKAAALLARRKDDAARAVLAEGLARYPQDRRLLKSASWQALRRGDPAAAERLLKQAVAIPAPDWESLAMLSYLYLSHDQPAGAAELRTLMSRLAVTDERMLRGYAILSYSAGDEAQARLYLAKADDIFLHPEDPWIRENYQSMAQAVLSRKIMLFCMQYPMRTLPHLKGLVAGLEGIEFIDNEALFKRALKKGSYADYFRDQYGGDFGHLTPQGNALLAGHVAERILQASGL
ncbi:MAG: hypothetical protein PHU21_08095 [Elusimicrobia bacterium]|nr:hypothetical protein [Elusimicrobiota bacterium]